VVEAGGVGGVNGGGDLGEPMGVGSGQRPARHEAHEQRGHPVSDVDAGSVRRHHLRHGQPAGRAEPQGVDLAPGCEWLRLEKPGPYVAPQHQPGPIRRVQPVHRRRRGPRQPPNPHDAHAGVPLHPRPDGRRHRGPLQLGRQRRDVALVGVPGMVRGAGGHPGPESSASLTADGRSARGAPPPAILGRRHSRPRPLAGRRRRRRRRSGQGSSPSPPGSTAGSRAPPAGAQGW